MKLNKKITLSTALSLCALPLATTSCSTMLIDNGCTTNKVNLTNDDYEFDVTMLQHITHHSGEDKDGAGNSLAVACRVLNGGNKWGTPTLTKQNDNTYLYHISHGEVDHTMEAAYTKFAISANLPAGKKLKLNFESYVQTSYDLCLTGSCEDWNQEIWNFDTNGAAYPTNYYIGHWNSYPSSKSKEMRTEHFDQLKQTNSWYIEHSWEDHHPGSHSKNWLDKTTIEFKTQKAGYNTWYFAYFVGEEQEQEEFNGDNHMTVDLTITPTIE